jgi:mannosyltransferase
MTVLSEAPARATTAPAEPGGLTHRAKVIAVSGVLVAGLVFFFWTRSDLWLDEALSVNIARLPLRDLPTALKHDGAPPLYYVLLHVWTAVLGSGDWAVRALSGVCMVGTGVALWFVGRRIAGPACGWITVLLLAMSPYAIRYATETRMYALEMLLVACGILAFRRALESPSLGRLAIIALIVALLLYTQYWALYLLLVVGVLLVTLASRVSYARAARRMLVAMAVGGLAFAPWLSTFLYQRAHTGTPWGEKVFPGVPWGYTMRDFAGFATQEGWLLLVPILGLLLLGLFGTARDDRHIEIDVHTAPGARWEAIVAGVTLFVGFTLNYLAGGAFETRYSALVFPLFVVVVARGVTTLGDPRVQTGILVVVLGLGFVGGVRNVKTNRTEAGQVAAVLKAQAQPGDLVVFCPDQLGPAVHRLVSAGLDEVTYPFFGSPDRVDWVDYKKRLARQDPDVFARKALARAGSHTIWLVTTQGYLTHPVVCTTLSTRFASRRPRAQLVAPSDRIFEHPGLLRFSARVPASG